MRAILCADKNWGIGKEQQTAGEHSGGYTFFRDTANCQSCGGDGTKDPGEFSGWKAAEEPDQHRSFFNRNYKVPDALVVHSEQELLEELKKYDTDEIYVIGGEFTRSTS